MSIITPVGIAILATLIMVSLQLTPGVFALFSHYAFGKFSKPKAADFILFFIIGAETITACLFMSIFFLIGIFMFDNLDFNHIFYWIFAGIFIGLGIASLFFYFRRGKGTKLFIPRKYAKALDFSAQSVKSRSDAFLLGALSGVCELFFTLPLYIVASVAILKINLSGLPGNLFAILLVLAPIIPLFAYYGYYRTGHNLADLEKHRIKSKLFIRLILCVSYFLIAALIISERIFL